MWLINAYKLIYLELRQSLVICFTTINVNLLLFGMREIIDTLG